MTGWQGRLADKPPPPVRLFARLRRAGFDLECPGCGKLHIVRPQTRIPKAEEIGGRGSYNERTCVFTCKRCKRRYVVGLNLYPLSAVQWPTKRNKRRAEVRAVPRDTVPTLGQAAAIRTAEEIRDQALRAIMANVVYPRWTPGMRKRLPKDPVNTAPACTCAGRWATVLGEPGDKDPGCPRHGEGTGPEMETEEE